MKRAPNKALSEGRKKTMAKRSNLDVALSEIRFVEDIGSSLLCLDGGITLPSRTMSFEVPGGISVGHLTSVREGRKTPDDALPHGICDIADQGLNLLVAAGKISDKYEWSVVDVSVDPESGDLFYLEIISDDVVDDLADRHSVDIKSQMFFPDWSVGYELESLLSS